MESSITFFSWGRAPPETNTVPYLQWDFYKSGSMMSKKKKFCSSPDWLEPLYFFTEMKIGFQRENLG